MFFCEACQESNSWPTSLSRSQGRCEICTKDALCYEVPSGALPTVRWTLYDSETDKPIREADMPGDLAARIKYFAQHPETAIKYERRKRKSK